MSEPFSIDTLISRLRADFPELRIKETHYRSALGYKIIQNMYIQDPTILAYVLLTEANKIGYYIRDKCLMIVEYGQDYEEHYDIVKMQTLDMY